MINAIYIYTHFSGLLDEFFVPAVLMRAANGPRPWRHRVCIRRTHVNNLMRFYKS